MTTSFHTETAKIYQFPVGGRASAVARRDDAKSIKDLATAPLADVAFGGSWYHDSAIKDDRTGKR